MENRKDKLRLYLEEQWLKTLPETKRRESKLHLETDLMNDITGVRRAGKTSLMFHLIWQLSRKMDRRAIIYINFEDRRLLPLEADYLNDVIEIVHEEDLLEKYSKVYLFLDEIQRIDMWEKYIRSIYDEFKGRIKIFISGSTSELTKSKLAYLLTGRHLTTIVFPLNFKEFLDFNELKYGRIIIEKERSKIEKFLREYLVRGGFPEIVLSKDETLIEPLFMDILNRDIVPKVKNKEIIESLAYIFCSYAGKLVSFSKLVRILENKNIKISVPTLEKYFWLMKDVFLFFDVQIFSYKVKDQLQYPRKIYCIDNGFVNYFGFSPSKDKGRMMENCVAIQLFRNCNEDPRKKLFYWKSKIGEEVDFVIRDRLKIKQIIQVCYDLDDVDTKKRELNALLKAGKELKCKNLLVITEDREGEERIKNKKILYVPLWKWLLK